MNKLLYTFLFVALAVALPSCNNRQDDIFDDSAANRLSQSAKDYTEFLASAPNGWALQYFANDY